MILATIYYWGTNESGHVAVEANGYYASLHPAGGVKGVLSSPSQAAVFISNLEFDINQHFNGRQPSKKDVNNVDDDRVEARAREIVGNQKRYQFLTSNCSHFVANCLSSGVVVGNVDVSLKGKLDELYARVRPSEVPGVGYLDQISDKLTAEAVKLGYAASKTKGPLIRKLIGGLIGAATVNHLLVRSPADVIRLADLIDRR